MKTSEQEALRNSVKSLLSRVRELESDVFAAQTILTLYRDARRATPIWSPLQRAHTRAKERAAAEALSRLLLALAPLSRELYDASKAAKAAGVEHLGCDHDRRDDPGPVPQLPSAAGQGSYL